MGLSHTVSGIGQTDRQTDGRTEFAKQYRAVHT